MSELPAIAIVIRCEESLPEIRGFFPNEHDQDRFADWLSMRPKLAALVQDVRDILAEGAEA